MSFLTRRLQDAARGALAEAKKTGSEARKKVATLVDEKTQKLRQGIQEAASHAEAVVQDIRQEAKIIAGEIKDATNDFRQKADTKLRKGVSVRTALGSVSIKKTRVRKTGGTRFDVKVEAGKTPTIQKAKDPAKPGN